MPACLTGRPASGGLNQRRSAHVALGSSATAIVNAGSVRWQAHERTSASRAMVDGRMDAVRFMEGRRVIRHPG